MKPKLVIRPPRPPPDRHRPLSWFNPYTPEPGSRLRISCHVDDFEAEIEGSSSDDGRDTSAVSVRESAHSTATDQHNVAGRSRVSKLLRRPRRRGVESEDSQLSAVLSKQRLNSESAPRHSEGSSKANNKVHIPYRMVGRPRNGAGANRLDTPPPEKLKASFTLEQDFHGDRGRSQEYSSRDNQTVKGLDQWTLTEIAERSYSLVDLETKEAQTPSTTQTSSVVVPDLLRLGERPMRGYSSGSSLNASLGDLERWRQVSATTAGDYADQAHASTLDATASTKFPTGGWTALTSPPGPVHKSARNNSLQREQWGKPRGGPTTPYRTKSAPELAPRVTSETSADRDFTSTFSTYQSKSRRENGLESVSPHPHNVADGKLRTLSRRSRIDREGATPFSHEILWEEFETGQGASATESRKRKLCSGPESSRKRRRLSGQFMPES